MNRSTGASAPLTLPVAQAMDTINPTEQDVIQIHLGALVKIVIITEVAMKKQMGLKRKLIQIAIVPESAVFRK